MPAPNLAALPSMDTLKIGPGGQTFAELKEAVLSTRADCIVFASPAAYEAHLDAVAMLRAAYVRVGLPYVAP